MPADQTPRCLHCGAQYTSFSIPGPVERKRLSQWWFRLFKSWPRSVVEERLAYDDRRYADYKAHIERDHGGVLW